jgi:hypothetical protein
MLAVQLDANERAILENVLESTLSDLRMEIRETDSLDFRDMLKDRKAVIGKLLDALRAA